MRKTTFILLLLLLLSLSIYSQKRVVSSEISISEAQNSILRNSLEEYQIVEIDLVQFKKDISTLQETRVLWTIDEKTDYDMRIHPKDIRSSAFQAAIVSENGNTIQEKGEINTYKGYLSNGNTVRLTVDDDFIFGGIQIEKGFLMVRQLKYVLEDKSTSPNILVLYRSDKVKGDGAVCGVPDELIEPDDETVVSQSSSAGCHIIEVAADCDTEYYNRYTGNVFNQMLGEFNLIQDLYENNLDAVLSITDVRAFIGSMYSSTNPSTIITEIKNLWWSSPYSSIPRDLVHHFTDKDLGYFGLASGEGVACNGSNKAVCWTRERPGQTHQTVAHEIGHLINGRHPDGEDCGIEHVRSIMCQGENKQLTFSPASITRLTNYIGSWTCFDYNTTYISGNNNICVNSTKTYTLGNFDPTAATNITWSLNNSRASIISGQGTESVVVKGNSSGQVTLKAIIDYPGSNCGNVTETKSLLIGPTISFTWSGPGPYGQVDVNVTGGSAPWKFYKNETTLIHTSYSSSTTVPFGCTGGSLEVRSTTSCGTGSYTDIIYGGCGGYYLMVYPNPAGNEVKVKLNTENENFRNSNLAFEGGITLTVYDFSATMVKSMEFVGSLEELKLDISDLKKGNYFLRISCKEIDETHQIIVE